MLYFCMGFHSCLTESDNIVTRAHNDASPSRHRKTQAYADNAWYHGDAICLLDSVPKLKDCFRDMANTSLKTSKSKLLVG